MVAPDFELARYSGKDVVIGNQFCRSHDSMIDFGKIAELCAESFADGLMAEADTEYGFLRGIAFEQLREIPASDGMPGPGEIMILS